MEAYENWTAKVNAVVQNNLGKPLLVRNEETLLLTMNFDPEVYDSYVHCHTVINSYTSTCTYMCNALLI